MLSAQCPTSTLSVYNITGDSATISWPTVSGVSGFEYAVLPATASAPASGTPESSGATIKIGGLSIGTAYNAWLRSDCGGGVYTPWASLSFSTTCGTPGTINISNVHADAATVNWTSVSPTAQYEYVIDTVATSPAGAGTSVNTNSVTVTGLLQGKTYYAFVRTKCSSAFSNWSAGQSFISAWPTQISTVTTNKIQAYPNPVINTLSITGLTSGAMISIYNTVGVLMSHYNVSTSPAQIDMSSFPSGIYILLCQDKNNSIAIRLLKK
ncbi:MAG: T9SS type A sorting domain-containing protein [Bacteroidetes bacterium]|nr:T9SS type A sorting domain-containing protein [Bacteroidota bacterium]